MEKGNRIKLNMSIQDSIIALAEGNPGALRVCMELFKNEPVIDPDSALPGLGALLSLDSYGVYGSDIWLLYKDVCKENTSNVLALLRADQLGQLAGITEGKILQEINKSKGIHGYYEDDGIDFDIVMKAVQERLPDFNKVDEE